MIPLFNGARVVACDVYEEVLNGRDDSRYEAVGVVLAQTDKGEWVTWAVSRRSGDKSFDAFWGHYHGHNRFAATQEYDKRRASERNDRPPKPITVTVGEPEPAFKQS
jgi:hypothetical protein